MKIGIITFHCAWNYGAVLQCFALYKTLEKLGHDVMVVDYRPNQITRGYRLFFRGENSIYRKTRSFIHELLRMFLSPIQFWNVHKRSRKFSSFLRTQMKLTKRIYKTADLIPEKFDLLIFGSDQIWNNKITGNDDFFFGHNIDFCKRISYGASAGATFEFSEENIRDIQNFKAVSVRESDFGDYITKKSQVPTCTVCDPTQLMTKEQWTQYLQPEISCKKRYLLYYEVNQFDGAKEKAMRIAREANLDFIYIWGSNQEKYSYYDKYAIADVSPFEFIQYIRDAAIFVTTSFHGVSFALLFEKEFIFLSNGLPNENRILELLDRYHAQDKIMYCNQGKNIRQKVQTENISELKLRSLSFLKELQ